jgi:hypothetical protein
MSAPFVNELRAGDDVLRIGGDNGGVLHIRVQAAELWDALRIDAAATASLVSVKTAALERFFPNGANPAEFVVKLRGFEILDEDKSVADCGVRDGSTLLLARRRRRPVK